MAKVASAQLRKPKSKTKQPKLAIVGNKKKTVEKKSAATITKPALKVDALSSESDQPAKKVSQKFLETIEKRKQTAGTDKKSPFSRPMGRRGRRPKAMAEYTPTSQEEDNYALESDYEGIEYDTGIRVRNGRDDGALSLDQFDDFDEELNFDR